MSNRILDVVDLKTYFQDESTGGIIKACDGVNLQMNEGEIVGLVGESGCGKSTIGRTIIGLEPPFSGKIIYKGTDILMESRSNRSKVRRNIQYIFQDPYAALSPRQTVWMSIEEAIIINGEKNKKAIESRVKELLISVGLDHYISDSYPRELSGGQRQRVCIARALATNPKVLICDEPASSLDVSIRAQIMNLFLKLRDDLGMSLLLISHDLSSVRQAAKTVYVMYLGKIVESGFSENVYANPLNPYTQSLLSAVPDKNPNVERSRKKILLSGDVPSPMNPPSGCRFRTRCFAAKEICQEVPPLQQITADHNVLCHFAGATHIEKN
jgi:peptide/nickel transport system ATP-binding protein|tara:strand:- start:593 stop:1570 length:978 start_codon:yes stop_codon:yes gene_type:complete